MAHPAKPALLGTSLGTRTRPFVGKRKALDTCLHLSCPLARMLTRPIRIVDYKWHCGNCFSPGIQCC